MEDQLNVDKRPTGGDSAGGPAMTNVSKRRSLIDDVARESYGKLLAWLSARTGDVAAAEDALSHAFEKACEQWPTNGAPSQPEAWLMTVAKRRLIDLVRKKQTESAAADDILRLIEERVAHAEQDVITHGTPFPDERLRLMLICAHPSIDPETRTPLMLQTVLGLDAARIASAFIVSDSSMAQRLVRAKRKIAAARIPFPQLDSDEAIENLPAVLDAIYAAYTLGIDDGGSDRGDDLGKEALYLAALVSTLAPHNAEAMGLHALLSFGEARRDARWASQGHSGTVGYIPFDHQDTTLWDTSLVDEAEGLLKSAAQLFQTGRFQLEAAIQSAHIARRLKGQNTRSAVITLYRRLLDIAPSIGAQIGLAAALTANGQPSDALDELRKIEPRKAERHQPFWATKAEADASLGNTADALTSFDKAIALSTNESVKQFLREKRQLAAASD